MSRRLGLGLGLGVLLLGSCTPPVPSFSVKLVTTSCVSPGPLDQVTHIMLVVSGPGMTPIRSVSLVTSHAGEVDGVPPGPGRVLEVRGYIGDPNSATQPGKVASVGRSLPFDIPINAPAVPPAPVPVMLRRVNLFVPPGSPAGCATMLSPRAAHTATLMPDGQVLIAGGFKLVGGAQQSLSSTEIFDPLNGTFQAGPAMNIDRAFQTGNEVAGYVLVAGGEQLSGGVVTQVLSTGSLYDPGPQTFNTISLSTSRTNHGAATAGDAGVLIVGGNDPDGGGVGVLEWFDPAVLATRVLADVELRRNHTVVAGPDGTSIFVMGGSDGMSLLPQVDVFKFGNGTFTRGPSGTLGTPRRDAAGALFSDAGVLLAGGYNDLAPSASSTALGTTELINLTAGTVQDTRGPVIVPRGDACAAAMLDGQVLTAGGTTNQTGTPLSDADAELITTSPTGARTSLGVGPLVEARSLHTCTTLADGSALILGGLDNSLASPVVLQDAWIFMPAPTE